MFIISYLPVTIERMILSFRHQGLRRFYETGATRGIRPEHARRLARVRSFLDRAIAEVLPALNLKIVGIWAMAASCPMGVSRSARVSRCG